MEQKCDSRNGLMGLLSWMHYEGHYVDTDGRSEKGLGCEGKELTVVLVAYWYIIFLLCLREKTNDRVLLRVGVYRNWRRAIKS